MAHLSSNPFGGLEPEEAKKKRRRNKSKGGSFDVSDPLAALSLGNSSAGDAPPPPSAVVAAAASDVSDTLAGSVEGLSLLEEGGESGGGWRTTSKARGSKGSLPGGSQGGTPAGAGAGAGAVGEAPPAHGAAGDGSAVGGGGFAVRGGPGTTDFSTVSLEAAAEACKGGDRARLWQEWAKQASASGGRMSVSLKRGRGQGGRGWISLAELSPSSSIHHV